MEHIEPPLRLVSTELTWVPRSRTFTAEASDFGIKFRVPRAVVITSHRTGQSRRFTLVGRQVDRIEGELLGWVYRNDAENVTLVFHND
jgi:hypothetical protein